MAAPRRQVQSLVYDARLIENSGIGTHIKGQLRELLSDNQYRLTLIGDAKKIHKYFPAVEKVIPFNASLYSLKEQFSFPDPGQDLLHIPHYNAPLRYLQNSTVTVHDLIHLQSDEFKLPIYRMYARFMLSRIAKYARAIYTVSETTSRDFLTLFPQAAEKTHVAPNGLDHSLYKRVTQSACSAFKLKYKLPDSFVLVAGIGKKHKNLDLVIRAMDRGWKDGSISAPLVIAGTGGKIPAYAADAVVNASTGNEIGNGIANRIIMLPFLDEAEMPVLYSSASVFVMASKLEGFGFPAVEAMACGCPVLSSTGGSLPEVCGKAALYFSPDDDAALRDHIVALFKSKKLRGDLAQRGRVRAKTYNWKSNVNVMRRVWSEFA